MSLGLSQLELATQARQPSSTVSMIETGNLRPDDAMLSALAAVLECTPDYLRLNRPEQETTRPLLRAYADAPKREVDSLVEDAKSSVEAALTLGLPLVPNEVPLYDGDLNDEDGIEQFALDVRAQLGLADDEPVGNAIRAAERLGCLVLPLDSELGRHLGMSFRVDEMPVIRVSRSSEDSALAVPGDRQRLTVAHELGHLTLHRFVDTPSSPVEASRAEREAYRFAGAFLIPGDALRSSLAQYDDRVTLSTLTDLKRTWGVAIKALVMRVRQLGIIDDDHARSLYKQISARKWNKVEPVPVDLENAVWWNKALTAKYRTTHALEVASQQLGLHRSHFIRWSDWGPAPRRDGAIDFATESTRRAAAKARG
jgi:Zn-dependent peptidase ImmA (M78 family)